MNRFVLTAMIISALGVSACGSSDDTSSATTSSSSSSAAASSSSGGGYGSKTTSTTANTSSKSEDNKVEMYDNYFQPKTISGKAGSTVKIELKNEGQREHNFKIDGQSADADVEAGEDASVNVKIPASGSVQFYCEYHKGLGMVGTVKAS